MRIREPAIGCERCHGPGALHVERHAGNKPGLERPKAAIDHTIVNLGRDALTGEERHIGGRELLAGIREFGADQFGPMAPLVFARWGVHATDDFGELVFNLIDAGLLSRRAEDSRLDFAGVYDLEQAFSAAYQERLQAISVGAN